VADKNFKVKSGLQVPSLTTAGPVTTDASGNVTSTAALPLSQGGTGQTTAGNALNALLPLQTGNTNKYLQSNGVSTQWNAVTQQTVTDALAGTNIYTGITAPSSPTTGDIWIDNTTGNGIQLVRWRKTIASGTSTISGLDDNNLTLTYTAGNEQVYINGTLITRGQDYTATNGTSISLTQAVEIGDTVEIFGNPLFSVTDTYTQAQADSRYINYSGLNAGGKNVLINGLFDFWQRSTDTTSSAVNGTFYAAADRWQNWIGSSCNSRYQRIADADPGFSQYSYRIQRVAGVSTETNYQLTQNIETPVAKLLVGKTMTLSFRVRKGANWSDPDGLLRARVAYNNNVDGNAINQAATDAFAANFNITNSFATYTMTGTIPASGVSTIMVNFFWEVRGTAGADDWLEFSAVQLEVGPNNTPFSRATGNIQGELAACQRYFVRYEKTGGNQTYFASGNVISTTRSMLSLPLPVNMRTSPSISRSAGVAIYNNGSNYNLSSLSVYQSVQNILNLDGNVSSGLTNNTSSMLSLTVNGDYLDFSAEL
jgi:hypothetical protein